MNFWITFWTVFLVISVVIFFGVAVVVSIGGFSDIKALFRDIHREDRTD